MILASQHAGIFVTYTFLLHMFIIGQKSISLLSNVKLHNQNDSNGEQAGAAKANAL